MFADVLLIPNELNSDSSGRSVLDFTTLTSNLAVANITNLCIHKYVKYTDTINDIISSINNDILNFSDCKLQNNPIKGNVYVLMGQIPYMVDDHGNTISTKYDSQSLGYTSYLDQRSSTSSTSSSIMTGKLIYIYYIIYDCYDNNYNENIIDTTSKSGKFERYIIPALDTSYASSDESCMSKCSQGDSNGYLCGCLSTIPYNKKNTRGVAAAYSQSSPGNLDLSINAVGANYPSLLQQNTSESDSLANASLIASIDNLADGSTCKTSRSSNSLSDADITSLNGGYAARCLDNATTSPSISNYMTLYKINQDTFKRTSANPLTITKQIFASQMT
jgi:hypothetical protein